MKIDQFVAESAGKFLTVVFVKKDGSVRTLNGRTGVTKHLKHGTSTVDHDRYLVLFDMVKKGYRCVNRSTIMSVTCGGLTVTNNKVAA